MKTRLYPLFLLGLVLCGALSAQGTAPPGFSTRSILNLKGPVLLGGFDVLPGGDILFFRDHFLMRWDGKTAVKVHAFPAGTYGAFVKATGKGVFVGESSTGKIYLMDPVSGKLSARISVRNPFDLVESPSGGIYVSANPGWGAGGSGNRIYLVDPAKGTLDEVARVKGPSGPLAFDKRGNLYYATQAPTYPTPPGAVRILRWTAAQVLGAAGAGSLTEKDASQIWKGLDGAFGMVLDRFGRIYVSDPQKGTVLRLDPASGKKEILLAAPAFPKTGYTVLRLSGEKGPASFDPWQPGSGGRILLCASDYLSFASLVELLPARPVLTCSPWPKAPAGRIRFDLAGGPPSSPALLLLSPLGAAPEAVLPTWGRAPLFLGVLPHPWLLALPLATGGKGGFTLDLLYPGGGPLVVYAQVFFPGTGIPPFTSSPWAVKLL